MFFLGSEARNEDLLLPATEIVCDFCGLYAERLGHATADDHESTQVGRKTAELKAVGP